MEDFASLADAFGGFMDDYGTTIGLGGQALGTILRRNALRKIEQEQARVLAAHRARQAREQAAMDARMKATLPQFTRQNEEATRAELAGQYEQYIQPRLASGDAGEYVNATDTTSTEVKDRAARELAGAIAKGRQHAKNSAALSAFGGLGVRNNILLGDTARDLNKHITNSQNYSAILPYQLEEAHGAGRSANLAADLANGLGQMSFLWGVTAPRKPRPQAPVLGSGLRVPQTGTLDIYGGGGGLRLGGGQGLRIG